MQEEVVSQNGQSLIHTSKDLWFEEIIRETDHYFQGEIQQEQRASWFLATSGGLLAIVVSSGASLSGNYDVNSLYLATCLVSLVLCAVISASVILPLRHTKSLWGDMFGRKYRDDLRKSIDELIRERFRHGTTWSYGEYEARLKYHYRSHFLRYSRKSYSILWASIFLILGLLAGVVLVFRLSVSHP